MSRPYRVLESKISLRQHETEPAQWKWLFSCIAIGVGFIFIPGVGIFCLVFFAAGLFGWIRYASGPGYYIGLQFVQNFVIKRARKHPSKNPKRARKPPIQVRLMSYFLTADKEEMQYYLDNNLSVDMGVAYYPPRDSDSSMTVAAGWDAANLDDEELMEAESRHAVGVMEVARNSYESVGYTIGLTTRPLNFERGREVAAWNTHLKIKAASLGTTLEELLRGNEVDGYEIDPHAIHSDGPRNRAVDSMLAMHRAEIQARKKFVARDVTAFYGLNIQRPSYWPETDNGDFRPLIKEKLITEKEIAKAPIINLTQMLAENLVHNGVKGVHVLNLDELKTFTRVAWDIKTVDNWHRGLTEASDGTLLDPTWPWPLEKPVTGVDDEHKEYFVLDGTYHRIYRMFGLNKRRVYPGEFASLFRGDTIGPADKTGLTVTLSADTLLARKEVKSTTQLIRFQRAFQSQKTKGNTFDYSQMEREEAAVLEDRRDALEHGGSHALNYNTFCVASAVDLKYLNGIDKEIQKKALDLSVNIKVIPWESRLNSAFWTATIGTGMM